MADDFSKPNPWLVRLTTKEKPLYKILCFAPAGAAAAFYQSWLKDLPSESEVIAIQLPGRWERISEMPLQNVSQIVRSFSIEVQPDATMPFAVIGFSFGALVAFEWLKFLQANGLSMPFHFIAAARSAPDFPTALPPLRALDDDQFIDVMIRSYNGLPAAPLLDPDLRALVLPPLRADMLAFQDYIYTPSKKLALNLNVMGGTDDHMAPLAGLEKWRDHFCGETEVEQYSGGHFFSGANQTTAVRKICSILENSFAKLSTKNKV